MEILDNVLKNAAWAGTAGQDWKGTEAAIYELLPETSLVLLGGLRNEAIKLLQIAEGWLGSSNPKEQTEDRGSWAYFGDEIRWFTAYSQRSDWESYPINWVIFDNLSLTAQILLKHIAFRVLDGRRWREAIKEGNTEFYGDLVGDWNEIYRITTGKWNSKLIQPDWPELVIPFPDELRRQASEAASTKDRIERLSRKTLVEEELFRFQLDHFRLIRKK
ncbi:MAG: hypothetical protein ACD_83C00257G0003 [uncultured bacterium]|uniref:Uncharacterized protein n=1 Tax=Berkelbacteria bacterium GW2011_GWA2_38_9 TaxID=1618334 RepID=A0A0G0NLI3_9BACT|nr:MAG: hypothetical protein ACD_83C00257G0003 [uncultured bacterium]KKQ86754.1 MAG: hypothetical protein UT11_C0063G0004 [Berkelbacteria bacterium GW2011_GWA2_38_9]